MQQFLLLILLVAGGITLMWVAKRLELGLGEASRIALLVVPAVIYFAMTGYLAEIGGLGLAAKFREISGASISAAAVAAELMDVSPEGSNPQPVGEWLARPCRPYYAIPATKFADLTRPETRDAVEQFHAAMRQSMLCGTFKALVILDQDDKPLGLFEAPLFQRIVDIQPTFQPGCRDRIPPCTANGTFDQIMKTELGAVIKAPEEMLKRDFARHVVVYDYRPISDTYEKLTGSATDTGAIVDRVGRFEGIITRGAIESWIAAHILHQSSARAS